MRPICLALAVVLLGGKVTISAPEASGRILGASQDATAANNQRKIAQTSEGLYLAYVAPEDGVDQVFVARSTDGGRRWIREARLSRRGIRASLPAVAADRAGRVHAVWVDYETVGHVWYAVRGAGGWSGHTKLSLGPDYAGFPAVAAASDGVHVVWYGVRPGETTRHGAIYEILHTRSVPGGWSRPALLSAGFPDSLNPALEAAGGVLQAAWYQFDGQRYRVHHATWREGRWESPALVSQPGHDAYGVALAVEPDGTAHLVWERRDRAGPFVTYARLSLGALVAEETVSAEAGEAPTVAVGADRTVYVAWISKDRVLLRRREGRWRPIQSLGPGAHPTLYAASEVWLAWTRAAGGTSEIVAGPVSPPADAQRPRSGHWLTWVIFAALVALYLLLRRSIRR
ncbi:MAG: sialidase family protein [Armatimonadota bacterium]|nr:sialidase family protein [Armatimonadota bacterium]MDR5696789.1 sialidase family protein [Armatimonadota bacterium]